MMNQTAVMILAIVALLLPVLRPALYRPRRVEHPHKQVQHAIECKHTVTLP